MIYRPRRRVPVRRVRLSRAAGVLSIVLDDADGKARREALFGQVKRVDLSCRSALDASGKHGAALDLTMGDVRVESHARNARLRVVLERDDPK